MAGKQSLPHICKGWKLRYILLFTLALGLPYLKGYGQTLHPHLLVTDADKQKVLNKIHNQAWADTVFKKMLRTVTPFVKRHARDPQWILSRYLMNRIPGKRYTKFYSDESGTQLIRYEGNAPVPTVRVSPHKRGPITPDGYSYRLPRIDELIPYDTSMKMRLQRNAPDSGWVMTDPKSFVGKINGRINKLALKAAIIYWLTGKTAYAAFAADILDQWAGGAYYQKPIVGPCRTGFLHIQTLGDRNALPLILAYDFIYNFLEKNGYDMTPYQTVLEKVASTMTFRGFAHNNWFAAQSSTMIAAALSLQDTTRRNYYLNFYLNKDTVHHGCGHLSIPTMVSQWLTPDGHWKETAGYHNYAIRNLLASALIMEKNGYAVFKKHPSLFKASYVLLKYAFPNLKNPAFGDNSGRPSEDPLSLEISLIMARQQGNKAIQERLEGSMHRLLNTRKYDRSSSGYLGLLCFLPNIPRPASKPSPWPRSGKLKYAGLYLQRNGTNPEHGLMYTVQGATYNHNHANGMAMELYGIGKVMGADPGDGLNYDAPLHIRYYAEWAAHNTVVTDGISASVPRFKGGGGAKKIGRIHLTAMEPKAGATALSPHCSFTITCYIDPVTKAPEERTMAIVRINDSVGYYVDVYRSKGLKTNDYLYHNIGDRLELLGEDRAPITTDAASFPIDSSQGDPPGFSEMKKYHSTGMTSQPVLALFRVPLGDTSLAFMQAYFPKNSPREFFTALAPATKTAGRSFSKRPTPTVIIHKEGPAWTKPFVGVYEPFSGEKAFNVSKVKSLSTTKTSGFTAIDVIESALNKHQIILQASDTSKSFNIQKANFKGRFGIIGFKEGKPSYLYLGQGQSLSWGAYSIRTEEKVKSSSNIRITGDTLTINSLVPVQITIPKENVTRIALQKKNGEVVPLNMSERDNSFYFSISAIRNGKILLMRSSE